ncbi:MAG: hypothetical protein M3165_04660, partial [Actinomycetota bacterium]|nr:hypothetical protein [Actinomycetota bacterium]
MGSNRPGPAARTVAALGAAAALVAASPGPAQAAPQASTDYDGDATALRIEGLALQLFPNGTAGVPAELQPLVRAFRRIRSHGPAELRRDTLTLAMPDQTVAHAQFPGRDTQGGIPDNPLVTAQLLEARSVRTRGGMLSQARVLGLELGGGVLSADVVKSGCAGDGATVALDVSQLALGSNQKIVDSRVSLEAGDAVPIAGVGSVTFNRQETDGSTYGEVTNVVIDLRSDLSLAALGRLFEETAPAMESAIKQVVRDLSRTEFGGEHEPFRELGENVDQLQGEQLWAGLDQVVDEGSGPLAEKAPELATALNDVAELGGRVTVANAACSQRPVATGGGSQASQQQAAPVQPAGDSSEPPLADTGSPAGT